MKNTAGLVLLMIVLALLPSVCRAQDDNRLVHEGIVKAPLDQVWAAFTTREGLESWMAAHAEIEIKLGGTMKSQYDPRGTIDDAKAIENTILSYEPMRMLSFKVTKAPQGFPFPNGIKNMWTVVYFEAQGEKTTRVRVVSMGFGNDDESKKMRQFFNRGNAFTLQQLQKRFAAKADAK
ncbi:MAG: SRPBCC domain-containing protein [Acidobacteriota bacterium]|nr:SRPBCC domain-containing protein [Acidobacteriota bacterium]